jgi:hypothetical protein
MSLVCTYILIYIKISNHAIKALKPTLKYYFLYYSYNVGDFLNWKLLGIVYSIDF